MPRKLSDDQRQARRERARARRREEKKAAEANGNGKSKPKKKRKKVELPKRKRINRFPEGVMWKDEFVADETGTHYGPLWVKGRRIGGPTGHWVSRETARDLARVLELKFKGE